MLLTFLVTGRGVSGVDSEGKATVGEVLGRAGEISAGLDAYIGWSGKEFVPVADVAVVRSLVMDCEKDIIAEGAFLSSSLLCRGNWESGWRGYGGDGL